MLNEKKKTIEAYQTLLGALETQVADAVRNGLTTQNDLLKVSLKRHETEVNRMRLEQGIELASRDLRRHIGLPEERGVAPTDPLREPEDPAQLRELKQGAAERRLEIGLLHRAVQAEQLQKSMKQGEMLPSVSVGGSLMHMRVAGMDSASNAILFGVVNVPLSGIWEGAL